VVIWSGRGSGPTAPDCFAEPRNDDYRCCPSCAWTDEATLHTFSGQVLGGSFDFVASLDGFVIDPPAAMKSGHSPFSTPY
jgi:hypothetical protein